MVREAERRLLKCKWLQYDLGIIGQFTSQASIEYLNQHAIRILMNGEGRVLDKVFIERLWPTVQST
jgi:hypothetical protein